MSIKNNLQRSLYHVLQHDNTGSYATRYDRQKILMSFAADLVELGYKMRNIHNLQTKHVQVMVTHWQQQGLVNGTIKNRMSAVRHLASLINKAHVIPDNNELNIGRRQSKPTF